MKNKDKFILVICGRAVVDSTIEDDLQQLAKELEVHIQMLGHRQDIPEINTCADIAVLSSLREGFGMTGVEAMASGVPVVGADVQGIREYVVSGKTGYLCDPMDDVAFAKAIEKIAEMDANERKEMSTNCIEMAMNFDVIKSKAEMKRIYECIVGEI